ncbi:hypothetical protein HMPREF0080_00385 [Anaeroglobus geminatus F0357]|uniref:Uncharacterized protein n=1 Tax=Anaeroglobus geminatus F0357 TaxID=861450 RepID=G9YFH4_9FIRM|nr:hypothetical protein HMPREF0080_00385 [Anaeroglobus geminatus F0357]
MNAWVSPPLRNINQNKIMRYIRKKIPFRKRRGPCIISRKIRRN